MNDFLDNLGKAVNEVANKAIKASGDAVELTKASLNIKFDEIKRESYFKEIGRLIYTEYKEDAGSVCCEAVLDFCKLIDEIEIDIDVQINKAARIKNKKFCVNCCIQIDKCMNFCHSCGTKQPEPVVTEEKEEEPEETGCCECEPVCECGCEEEPECGTEPEEE